MPEPINHLALPNGSVLRIESKHGCTFSLELAGAPNKEGLRSTKVLQAPSGYEGPRDHIVMCCASDRARDRNSAEARADAIPTITRGDTVYLIDLRKPDWPALVVRVHSIEATTPR